MMGGIKVCVVGPPSREFESYQYECRGDGWYVNFGDGFERFAVPTASEETVRVLIRKERSALY
jgi:hypothetical protein